MYYACLCTLHTLMLHFKFYLWLYATCYWGSIIFVLIFFYINLKFCKNFRKKTEFYIFFSVYLTRDLSIPFFSEKKHLLTRKFYGIFYINLTTKESNKKTSCSNGVKSIDTELYNVFIEKSVLFSTECFDSLDLVWTGKKYSTVLIKPDLHTFGPGI